MRENKALTHTLTGKELIFVKEFQKDGNATRAAIAAGYSKKTAAQAGARLKKKVKVVEARTQLIEERCDRLDITNDYVLGGVKEVIGRCMQAVPVVNKKGFQVETEDAEGNLVPAFTFNAFGALKGLELLGRYRKLFSDKGDIPGSEGGLAPVEQLTDAELEAIVKAAQHEANRRGGNGNTGEARSA